ncbi:lysophospholipase L1-like esterase [Breoghania corrubedonensis]|uniref:Lysophospholipase L1-like esterase n=1 Tax=Breoghania corrubedonensis TaxID=665038 RepID=A0A2T5VEH8_9HYPH|nr:SGNH/GDSL hydrolase family protein [Breoghania corrubedonensis]PTW62126.1 lysophospholipase L1-like esterase [Breoghania corrubedonensis]
MGQGSAAIRLAALASWLAFPVYAWQGIGVRLTVRRLLPAPGEPSGRIAGEGTDLRLLVVGDSSAAGVGIDHIEEGLAAQVARILNERTGRAVSYRTAGFNSAISNEIRDHVMAHIEPRDWTHVIISIGTNDIKNFRTGKGWKKGFGGLLYALRARFPQAALYWPNIMPMDRVPALPPTLGRILERRAALINMIGNTLCAERGATAIPRMLDFGPDAFCEDGFHPSAAGMADWGEHVVDHMHLPEAP